MKEITLKFGGTIYFSVESLDETRSMYRGLNIQDLLDVYADQMAEKESVEALLDYLGVNWLAIYPSAAALHKAEGLEVTNEWVNHIGKYYVLVDEY